MSRMSIAEIMAAAAPWLAAADPNRHVKQQEINADAALIQAIAPHIIHLRGEEGITMLDAFEYHSPTGLNVRPIPEEIRVKLRAIVARFENKK